METRVWPTATGSSPLRAAMASSVVISRVAESCTVDAQLTPNFSRIVPKAAKAAGKLISGWRLPVAMAGSARCGRGKKTGATSRANTPMASWSYDENE